MKDKQYSWKCIYTNAIIVSDPKQWEHDELVGFLNRAVYRHCNFDDLDKYYCLEVGVRISDVIQNMPPKERTQMPRINVYENLSLCDNEFRIMERVKNPNCFDTDDIVKVPDYNISDNIRVNPNPISPEHYKRLSPEPKDVIRSWGLNFNLGSAVKYISRAGHKDDIIQDLKKAQQFIQFEIDYLEGDKE